MTAADSRQRLPAVILLSGRGSNMRVIAEQASTGSLAIEVRAVMSDRPDAAGLETARQLGIDAAVIAPRPGSERSAYDRELAAAIRERQPGLVVLAGFMRVLSPGFVAEFLGRLLNIHPSLLPKYRGLHTHARVLAAREAEHGASVHFVTPELDAGPVVIQGRVPILPGDDEKTLAARVQRVEHRIYPEAISWIAGGRLDWNGGHVLFDGAPLTAPRLIDDTGA
ncbi:MAG TPA: phosphoribosylglycinamide formyltransferase [Steroidobacteraceae bacterium]|nr:phosphoribosylglycinamide formyltransferase [Steroidobacteraceae bacterium]